MKNNKQKTECVPVKRHTLCFFRFLFIRYCPGTNVQNCELGCDCATPLLILYSKTQICTTISFRRYLNFRAICISFLRIFIIHAYTFNLVPVIILTVYTIYTDSPHSGANSFNARASTLAPFSMARYKRAANSYRVIIRLPAKLPSGYPLMMPLPASFAMYSYAQ